MGCTLEVAGAGCWDRTLAPTVSEIMKSFDDRLNRPSRQTAGVPPFRNSFLPQFLHAALGLRLPFRRVFFRQRTYFRKIRVSQLCRRGSAYGFPVRPRPQTRNDQRDPRIRRRSLFRGVTRVALLQGLRSASQPAERRVPPLILHRAPLRVRARAYGAGSGATDPSGVSTDAS